MNAPSKTVREQVSAEEWQLRVDLAACYRLVAMWGWDDLIFTHISARLPGPEHHFLINPYGWMFDEINASSLVKVDMDCRPVIPTPHSVNPAGFVIHSAIHQAREDVVCVLHTHTPAGVGVASQPDGLLPLSQQAAISMRSLAYHDYEGIAVHDDEKPRLQADLGTASALILRNHGLLTVGPSIADAFLTMYQLQRACEVQVAAQAGSKPPLQVSADVLADVPQALKTVRQGKSGPQLVWPALLRRLDRRNPGYDE